ncbi:hypothetical protein AKO1_007888 [Acrasis kona]|uniref:Protein kinase domain-containing protein n=1 Tax=Acrasis kona TaxID=1008807 RepID=A0AAW2YSB7_9EUKA
MTTGATLKTFRSSPNISIPNNANSPTAKTANILPSNSYVTPSSGNTLKPPGISLLTPLNFSVTTIPSTTLHTGSMTTRNPVTMKVPKPPGPMPITGAEEDLRRELKEYKQLNDTYKLKLIDQKDRLYEASDRLKLQTAALEKTTTELTSIKKERDQELKQWRKHNRPVQLLLIGYLLDSLKRDGGLSEHAILQVENMMRHKNNGRGPPRIVKYLCECILHRVAVRNHTYKYRIQGMLDFDEHIDEDIFYEGNMSYKSLEQLKSDRTRYDQNDVTLVVDPESDLELLTFVEGLRYDMRSMTDLKKAYLHLSVAVDQRMGRAADKLYLETPQHIQQLQQQLDTNVLYMGFLRRGTSRHRALLFKFLCDELRSDRLPLKCRLVQGSRGTNHAWNVVVNNDGQMLIVDLIELPGVMFPEGSHEADDYKRARFTNTPCTDPFVRGWLRPLNVESDLQDKQEIGSGGYGKVYKVTLSGFNPPVQLALKVVQMGTMLQQERDKAAEELDLLRYMRHKNVIALRYGCIHKLDMYMFMDLMDSNLHDFIHNNIDHGSYFERECIYALLGSARGIAYLHGKNLIHRDIKPANVLISVKQTAKGNKILKVLIADFGISKQLFQAQETKTLIGTPVYMAREMFMGSYDSKVDVYSYGVMMAECICRRLPRQHDPFTVNELINISRDNQIMLDMVDLQQRCVKPHPDMRPSMEEVVESLEELIIKYYSN